MVEILTVGEADRDRALSVQLLAFSADPVIRWLWPDSASYLRHFPELLVGFGGRAFEHQAAHATADLRGGAMWLPPGIGPDEAALEHMVATSVREGIRAEIGGIFEQMDASVPAEPHWHLAFIGVDPHWYGSGVGSALLEHALRGVDEQGTSAYLESTNPRNLTLYQRYGFEVTHEIRVGDAPPLFPMVRPPR